MFLEKIGICGRYSPSDSILMQPSPRRDCWAGVLHGESPSWHQTLAQWGCTRRSRLQKAKPIPLHVSWRMIARKRKQNAQKMRASALRTRAQTVKKLPGGLEGRSPPSTIRIRRHVRRIRKPCCARFPYAVSRPGGPSGREGNSANTRKRTPQADFFDTLCARPLCERARPRTPRWGL